MPKEMAAIASIFGQETDNPMSEKIISTLKKIDLFNSLTDEMFLSLGDKFQAVSLKAGQVLFNKGDQGDSLYLVQVGRLKVISTDAAGYEVILNQITDGDIVGEMALIDQQPRSAGVIAMTETTLLKLSSDDFLQIMQQHPEIGLMISRNLTQRLRNNTTQIENAIPSETVEAHIEARTANLVRDNQKLKEMATTDALTGALNRRSFFELAEQELKKSQRYNLPLSAIMIDLDHFKSVNDTYGHQAGDVVLQSAARLIQENIREIDIFGRYGGEEFAVLMPNTPMPEVKDMAERICQMIAAHPVQVDEASIPVTASLGAAGVDDTTGLEITTLLDRADQALYQAKEGGRNRVVAWGKIV